MQDKLDAITSWLYPILQQHKVSSTRPFVLAISGVQGSGKSTIVESLETSLKTQYWVAQVSLDDLYLTHQDQLVLAQTSGVSLWRTRGQFGTHDVQLAETLFTQLGTARDGDVVKVPRYDKSCHDGRGDRLPQTEWPSVTGPLDVVILEGWGVGFQAPDEKTLRGLYDESVRNGGKTGSHSYDEIKAVNDALTRYNKVFMGTRHFDALVVLQAEKTECVYTWRLQQEHAMWKAKGRGMTDEQVREFVDRYYPSYELYLPRSITGIFGKEKAGRQLNLKMNDARVLQGVDII